MTPGRPTPLNPGRMVTMAIYRNVQISYWQDSFVLDLTSEEKFFYLYLLTNSKTSQCGIYELPMQVVQIETGYNQDTVLKLLDKFVEYGKIEFCKETKEVYIKNWIKYNPVNNINVEKRVMSELAEVKCQAFVQAFLGERDEDPGEVQEETEEEPSPLQGATKGLPRGYEAPTKETTTKTTITKTPELSKTETIAGAPDESEPVEIVDNVDNSKDAGQGPEDPPCPYQKIMEEWNRICTGLDPASRMTKRRRKHLGARWKQFGKDLSMFSNAFGKIQASDFCRGQNDRGWTASFDWIIQDDTNMVKVLEGKYRNKSSPKVTPIRRQNAFHNYQERELPYTEEQMAEILRKKRNG